MKIPDAQLESLSPRKRELLELLMKEKGRSLPPRGVAVTPPPPPPAIAAPTQGPLSFAQQRLWFIDQWMPGSTLYNEYLRMRVVGPLDRDALARSLEAVVARHGALRTVFRREGDEAVQIVLPNVAIALPFVDLSELSRDARDAQIERLERDELARPFDLTEGPLVRGSLVKVSADEHALLVSVHHIVCDGWSLGLFMRELGANYAALLRGRTAGLPPLALDYLEYARRQRDALRGPAFERQVTYWKERLQGAPPVLQLPTARKRPAVRGTAGATEFFEIGAETAAALKALARRHDATLFMVLMAAFQALLHRYTGQDDICVGTPIANRRGAGEEALIGFFVNALVLRVAVSGDLRFEELLSRVRDAALGAYANQDVPLEHLVEELKVTRNLAYTPLFQVVFVLHNTPTHAFDLGGLRIEPVERDRGTSKFDWVLALTETPAGLTGGLEYDTDLFDPEMIRSVVGHFSRMLDAIARDPGMSVNRLPLLSDTERHHLVVERNPTKAFPSDRLLHGEFERQAALHPERVAVTCDGVSLTYADLDRRSNQLARYLQARGVGRDVLVGLYVERSVEMIVGVLGILKAGGAYVPLDPSSPADRLSFMIEDSGARIVVTQASLEARMERGDSSRVRLDADWEAIGSLSEARLDCTAHASSQLAYVIYTSGSTGKPKGVLVTHANVARLFTATEAWFGFGEKDVWTLFHSIAFDFSVWELWGALLYGGKLVVVPYAVSRAPDAFYTLLDREGVTVLSQTPSAFRQLVREDELAGGSGARTLRYVVFGGEALELASLRPWYQRHAEDAPRLVNMYGITETTVHVTYRPIGLADVEEAKGSVIGVPIRDLDCYVLDATMEPVPLGVTGELYVGGAGVARGYLNRPELTAQRFVPNPFRPSERLYKSGDLVRALPAHAGAPTGDLEYIGRSDFQVKIRGFRVELGEIEAALAQKPGVRECAVLVRDAGDGDKRLVAYVVPATDVSLDTRALHDALAVELPAYMVPSAFVVLEAFPITGNGKLDRAKLPEPDTTASTHQGAPQALPGSELEHLIAEEWRAVLKVDAVGIDDNFFDVGGNSLNLASVQSRLRDRLKRDVPMLDLFRFSTIRDLARHLSAPETPDAAAEAPAAEAVEARRASAGGRRDLRRKHRAQGNDDE